jgi:hypothetical protein
MADRVFHLYGRKWTGEDSDPTERRRQVPAERVVRNVLSMLQDGADYVAIFPDEDPTKFQSILLKPEEDADACRMRLAELLRGMGIVDGERVPAGAL